MLNPSAEGAGNFHDRRLWRKQGVKIGDVFEKIEDQREAPDDFFGNTRGVAKQLQFPLFFCK